MKLIFSSLTAFGLAIGSACAQTTIGLDFAAQNGGALAVFDGTSATLSTADVGELTAIGFVQDGEPNGIDTTVTLTEGGFSGVYQISVDISAITESVARGGSGTLGTTGGGSNLMTAGEALTFENVVLTFVSGDNAFRFDGFNGVRIGNLSGAEVATISDRGDNNLITIIDGDEGEGGGNDFGPTAPFALTPSVVYVGAGTSLNVLDAQFSLIPADPIATLSVATPQPVVEDFTLDVVFSEDVTGLEAGDFVITNGTAGTVTPASGPASVFSVTVVPTVTGDIEISLPAGAVQDLTGSTSLASNTLFIDAVLEPTVELSTLATEPVPGAFTLDVVFNQDVSGVELADFVVTNGIASDVLPSTGPASTYTVTITPTLSGDVAVSLPAAAAQNGNGLDSFASNAFSIFAVLPPADQATVTLSTAVVGQVFGGTFVVDVLFSEDVLELDAADFAVTNGVVVDITPEAGPASVYAVTIDSIDTGDVSVTLNGAGVLDFDDSLPTANSNTLVVDFFNPSVPVPSFTNLDASVDGIISGSAFTLFVDFSEGVSGLELSDFVVTNGTASSLVEVAEDQYDINIAPASTGAVIVELLADSVTDLDGEEQGNPQGFYIANNVPDGVFTIELLDLAGRDGPGLGEGESGGTFASPRTFNSISDLSLNDIPFDNGVISGTFDLSFVATGSPPTITRTGRGGFGINGLIGPEESVSIGSFVASDLTGGLVGQEIQNIQVISVFLGNFGGIDISTINGFPAVGTGSGATAEAQRNNIPASSSAIVEGSGGNGGSITAIAVSFEVGIPVGVIEITDLGFEGDNFFIEIAREAAGLSVTSSDNLDDFADSPPIGATIDPSNPNRFLIPSSERNVIRDFFRVEEE